MELSLGQTGLQRIPGLLREILSQKMKVRKIRLYFEDDISYHASYIRFVLSMWLSCCNASLKQRVLYLNF